MSVNCVFWAGELITVSRLCSGILRMAKLHEWFLYAAALFWSTLSITWQQQCPSVCMSPHWWILTREQQIHSLLLNAGNASVQSTHPLLLMKITRSSQVNTCIINQLFIIVQPSVWCRASGQQQCSSVEQPSLQYSVVSLKCTIYFPLENYLQLMKVDLIDHS